MSRFSFLLFFACIPALAQTSPEELAMDRMQKKGKWSKVEQSFRKSLSKDWINPEARYMLSLFYFNKGNPSNNLDSAYAYSLTAMRDLESSLPKDRERLKRIPLDSILLLRLTARIDSTAFEKARQLNSEAGYQYFIDRHKTAAQMSFAIELRDEVAYIDALKTNTWSGFQKFIAKYPSSLRQSDAQSRYDKLLLEDKTSDHKLSSYVKFYKQFPKSPYRSQVEKSIFDLSTASGSPESFRGFIAGYPSSKSSFKAKNILFKLQLTEDEDIFDDSWMTDSLKYIEQLNKSYWVPVIKSGKYGFIDDRGEEIIAPSFEMIAEEYRCGDVRDRVLVTSSGLIARNGKRISQSKVNESKEIGLGYLLLSSDSAKFVIHESGFNVGPSVDAAHLIANRFIGLEKGRKWSIYSLTGNQLLPFSYDEITAFDSLIVLTKGGKKILTTPGRIGKSNSPSALAEDFVFDEVRRWGPQQYWVRNGLLEGVIDARLNFIILLDRQQLRKTSFGFIYGKDDKVFLKGISRFENIVYKTVNEQAGWIRLQTGDCRYQLYDKGLDRIITGDSVWFQGQLAFLESNDSVKAFLPEGQKISFPRNTSFQFKEYRDSASWLLLDDKKKKVVYDAVSGIKLFTLDFDQLEAVSPDAFLITRANKKGLISEDGKIFVPIEYDAIVSTEPGGFSLLKDKKFGSYDVSSKLLIKPTFERNIRSYNHSLKMAFKEKGYGFIYPDGKLLGTFEWEDIQYWNDSTAWVKKNFQWILFEIYAQKTKLDRVRNYTIVKDSPDEKIYIIRQDNALGVISNRRGIIVPIQYSDVINLGSKDVPLYFTERNIEEAGISVVVYFDHRGKVIRKQAMETDEFEKINCDN